MTPSQGTITVTPDTGLVDEQVVTVAGSGFEPGFGVQMAQCGAVEATGFYSDEDPAMFVQCGPIPDQYHLACTERFDPTADAAGGAHTSFAVEEQFHDPQTGEDIDCREVECFIGTGRPSGRFPDVQVPLSFGEASPAAPTTPEAIQPAFTG